MNFKKRIIPYETAEQRNKRLQDAQAEGGWGASGTAVENTVEGPYYSKN
jgi:taurine transport system permease protein